MPLPSVPFFYVPGSPPPPLPLLVIQTEILVSSAIVLAQEPIELKQPDNHVAPRLRLTLVKPRQPSHVTFDLKP